MSERYCEVCNSNASFEPWRRRWGFSVSRCRTCGIAATELPEDFDLAGIYSEDYYEGGAKGGECAYRSYGESRDIVTREFRQVVDHVRRYQPRGRLLEIGCAYGFLLDVAKTWFEVTGLELSTHAASVARERSLDVRAMTVEDAGFAPGSFDAVVMLDTIEHLAHPRRTLAEIFRILAPGGIVVITTGNVDSLHARLLRTSWRLFTPPQHTFFFSAKTIDRMLSGIGFSSIEIATPWKLVPLSLILYQAQRWYGVKIPIEWFGRDRGIPINLFDIMRVTAQKPH